MILLAFDLETTGLDFVKDRPIEVGAILYSTGQQKCLESQGFLVKTDAAISAEITKLTGITQQAVDKFGYESDDSLAAVTELMNQADAVIGHNVVRFDKRMLQAWQARHGWDGCAPEKLWIDTYTDLPDTEVGKLTLMAANAGFLNMFPHSALADCQTVLKLIESENPTTKEKYDINKIVERAKSPTIVVQAHQARHQNDLAKKAKFRWYPEKKMWWKFVKEMDLEGVVKDLQFDVSVHRENIEEFQNL
jgi:DNA polymerase III alpha subunit (gram-positive type)